MIITTGFETLDTAMATVTSIVSDKMLKEDLKNLVIWVKDGEVRFSAYNGNISSATKVDAQVILPNPNEEVFVQLKAKDINDVLASFKGLSRTKVAKVELEIKETEAIMQVFEEPIDSEQSHAEEYFQRSKFRITKPRLKDAIKSEIQKINTNVDGVEVTSIDMLLYINSLYPTVQKETRESTDNVLFGKEYIYTVLAPYSAIMENRLPEVISGFRLKNTIVNFLKNFITGAETFTIDKQDMGNGMVVLTVKVGDSVAVIKCADMSRAFDMTNFVTTPANGVVVDKAYLIDVLKRMSLSSEAAYIDVTIVDGRGELKVVSKNMTQNIPVVQTKGEGSFPFSIRAELLSSVIFSHIQGFGENVFLYLEHGDRGNIIMAVKDNTNLWQTKITGLASSKGDFAWS